MALAPRAHPPFHKRGAIARLGTAVGEGGDGRGKKQEYCGYDDHVSQLLIYTLVRGGGVEEDERLTGSEEADLPNKANPPSWSATAYAAFEAVVGSMPPLASSPWSTAPSPIVVVVVRVAVRGNLHPRRERGVLHQSLRGHPP